MPPKRKASQATSSRRRGKKAIKDPVKITDDGDFSLNDSAPAKPTNTQREAACGVATKDDAEIPADEDDTIQTDSDAPLANRTARKSRGKAPALVVKSTNLDVFAEGDAAFARPTKRARKAPTRTAATNRQNANAALDDDDDDEADPEPTTIEQSLLKQNKASRQYLQDFKQELVTRQDKAHQSLAALKADLLKTPISARDNLMCEIRDALRLPQATESSPANNNNNNNNNNDPVLEQAQKILDLSQSVLGTHRAIEKAVSRPELVETIQGWDQDKEKMAKLLLYGRKQGMKIVEGIIDPAPGKRDRHQSGGKVKGPLAEEDELAAMMFSKTRSIREGELTWGVAARKQLEALVGVVNTLPKSDQSKEGME